MFSKGKFGSKTTYAFNNDDKSVVENQYYATGAIISQDIYYFDSNQNLIKQVMKLAPMLYNDSILENANINSIVWAANISEASSEVEYSYVNDVNGNMLELTVRDLQSGIVTSKSTCAYDAKGNIIEEIDFNQQGNLQTRYTYVYDQYGNATEVKNYKDNGILQTTMVFTYEYDKHKNWIRKIEYENGVKSSIYERTIVYY